MQYKREETAMPRFFVGPDAFSGKFAVLTGEAAAHARVLRLKQGDKVTLCTGDGRDHNCAVSDVSPRQYSLVVDSTEPSVTEPKTKVSVYMAYAKGDKPEHVIQKATELGAYEIVAFPSSRCVSRPDDKSLKKKLERWQKIAAEAAQQSGRGAVPQVITAESYGAALSRAGEAELAVMLYENEDDLSLRAAIQRQVPATVSLMTGPEGGFSEEEVKKAQDAGLLICTLGKRILRCETAPLCALTAVMFACGELD